MSALQARSDIQFLRLMYVTTTPILHLLVPLAYPIPLVGEHVEIEDCGGRRFVIENRTWDIDASGQPGVALHVREF